MKTNQAIDAFSGKSVRRTLSAPYIFFKGSPAQCQRQCQDVRDSVGRTRT